MASLKECLATVAEGDEADLRPVDDMSASGVNACCSLEEKLSNDGVDTLFQVARKFYEVVGEVPDMFKADIDSAYRRIPLAAADR